MNLPSRRFALLAILVLAFLGVFGWVVATQGPLAPIKVTTVAVAETSLQPLLFGIGTVEARRSYAIGPTVAGRVASVLVDHGDVVKPGQLLAEMDPVDLDARHAASGAAAARAAELVAAAQAARAEAGSRARVAQANADRYADLRRQNFVSQEAADAKAHEAAAARAGEESAIAVLAAAKDEVQRARAEQAGLGKSRAHLRLTSPVAGVVSARLAEPGSTIVAGQAVVQVIDPASLWMRVRIDQGNSAGLAVGMDAEVVLRSNPGAALKGRVERVDLLGDSVTEERVANVTLAAPPGDLLIGALAEVRLRLPSVARALVVPAAAVKRVGGTSGVWVEKDGRPAFRAVKTGVASADGLVQIRDGLQAGTRVIVYSERPINAESRIRKTDALAGKSP